VKDLKEILWGLSIGVCTLVVVSTGVIAINALSGTPAPATAPCVAPSPSVVRR
jgi:hypothetical protein